MNLNVEDVFKKLNTLLLVTNKIIGTVTPLFTNYDVKRDVGRPTCCSCKEENILCLSLFV